MALVKRTQFEAHPEGLTVGVLVDIQLDEQGKFGTQIRWSFDTQELMQDGRPFRITYWTTPTLNEKSNLSRLLKALGEDPEDEQWEVESVDDFDCLLNRKVQLNIIHKRDGDTVRARIDTIMPLPRKPKPKATAPAGRVVVAETVETQAASSTTASPWDDED